MPRGGANLSFCPFLYRAAERTNLVCWLYKGKQSLLCYPTLRNDHQRLDHHHQASVQNKTIIALYVQNTAWRISYASFCYKIHGYFLSSKKNTLFIKNYFSGMHDMIGVLQCTNDYFISIYQHKNAIILTPYHDSSLMIKDVGLCNWFFLCNYNISNIMYVDRRNPKPGITRIWIYEPIPTCFRNAYAQRNKRSLNVKWLLLHIG